MKPGRLNIHSTKSERPGFSGLLETLLRKYRTPLFIFFLLPIVISCVFCVGLSLAPGVILFQYVSRSTLNAPFWLHGIVLGCTLAMGFVLYGLTLILIVPLCNKLVPFKVRPQKATWYSLSVVPWYYHNVLTYLVRYTFLDFITPTPFNILFYKMMGMKVGRGSMINTSNISDPCLIEIGNDVTIGGSATLVAHYGMKGILIIERLIIRDNVTIGLKASLFGDVIVGAGQTVQPHQVLLPKTHLPDLEAEENTFKNKDKPRFL